MKFLMRTPGPEGIEQSVVERYQGHIPWKNAAETIQSHRILEGAGHKTNNFN